MQKIYIAAVAECDNDGELYVSTFHGTTPEVVLSCLNHHFNEEAEWGHEVLHEEFKDLSDANGFDSFDTDNCNHYHISVEVFKI